jgi:hypothetical protein
MRLVTLSSAEMATAATVGIWRHVASRQNRMSNLRGLAGQATDEVWFVDILGAMGELAFAKCYGLYWPATVNVGKDQPDVPPLYQVRTARRHDLNLIVRPDDPDHFRYALVTGNGPDFRVHGHILGRDAKRLPLEDRGGRGEPAHWVSPSMLADATASEAA